MASYSQASAGDVFLQVVRASRPRVGVLTALAVALTAHLIGRPFGQVSLILLTVLVGQAILGWHNDLTDEVDDRRHELTHKPLVSGPITARTLWIALTIAAIALIPLAISVGIKAGLFYVGSVLVAMTGNVVLRTGPLSFLSWAASYALLVPYLSYAGDGPHSTGRAPEVAMIACFALVGIGIHVAVSLWGLVNDDADGWTSLPLALGRKFGATQTMAMVIFYLAGVAVAVTYVAHTRGFSR
jgi:4-hydroxybenzoate polyprenyltransferase